MPVHRASFPLWPFLVLACTACEGDLPEGQRPPRPFAQSAAAEERRMELNKLLAALNGQRGAELRQAVLGLSSWSMVNLGRNWNRLGPAITQALDQGRLLLDEDLVDLLARMGPRAFELVGRGLLVEDGPTRRRAAERLVQTGSEGIRLVIGALKGLPVDDPVPGQIVIEALRKQAAAREPRVRVAAADLLWLLAEAESPRLAAAPGLGSAPESLLLLRGLLDDPDPEVRVSAIERLAALGERAALALLEVAARAGDPVPGVAQVALSELHRFGPKALDPLATLLDHREPATRQAALDALGRLGQALSGDRVQNQPVGAGPDGGVGSPVSPVVVEVIGQLARGATDDEGQVRLHAYRALSGQTARSDVDQVLIRGLEDREAANRLVVVELLGGRDPNPSLVEALALASGGADEPLALQSLASLARYGQRGQGGFGALVAVAAKGSEAVRGAVGKTAFAIQPDLEKLLPLLGRLLDDPAVSVREEALVLVGLHGAGMIRSGQAPKSLEKIFDRVRHMSLEDPATTVRQTAVNALTHIQKSFQPTKKEQQARDPSALSYPGGG